MTSQDECRAVQYQYKPKLGGVFAATTLFLLGTLFMGYVAATNAAGLIINHLIRLDAAGATSFYWLIAVLCAGMTVVGLNGIRLALMKTRCILLSLTEIEIPANWPGSENTIIPFRAITGLELEVLKSSRIIVITSNFRKTRCSQRFFDDEANFEDCLMRLRNAVEATRQHVPHVVQKA